MFILLLTTLGGISFYTIEFLFSGPFPGFDFNLADGTVTEIYLDDPAPPLRAEDIIVDFNGISLEAYRTNRNVKFYVRIEPGDSVPIVISRDGQLEEIKWNYPGWTRAEFIARLQSQWWMAYAFYITGLLTYLFVRPRDTLWGLFTAFNTITSLWIAAGSGPAGLHVWSAPIILRAGVWLTIPVLIHLHWLFPSPFKKIPPWAGRILIGAGYLICFGFLIRDVSSQILYPSFNDGLLFGATISLGFLLIHYMVQKDIRDQIKIIFRVSSLALIPVIVVIGASYFIKITPQTLGGAIIGFPLIPFSYFFALWQGNLGRYEVRANQSISVYVFFTFLFFGLLFALNIMQAAVGDPAVSIILTTLISVIAAISSIQVYPAFKRFVERRLLDIPFTSTGLVQSFASQITTTQDTATLGSLFDDLILPSLLVRQSVLLSLTDDNLYRTLYLNGVVEEQVPPCEILDALLGISERFIPPFETRPFPKEFHWIRVVLPLKFDEKLIGVWLLGRRDPDDFYDDITIEMLKVLANQTSIALVNHQQTQRLRVLYQLNIDRHEVERARLARDLHDETLNNLAMLQQETHDPEISTDIDVIITKLRKTIHGLRPEMLSYGLMTALEDLSDTLNERQSETLVSADIKGTPSQIDPNVELHLFRIVQQACENALRHADASALRISGSIDKQAINLDVIDDGGGFDISGSQRLSDLLTEKRYGLAGMYERASLIGAHIQIDSAPGKGTTISLNWDISE